MEINKKEFETKGIKFLISEDGKEIGRIFLYIIKNDLRDKPYGYLEDLFVAEKYRKHGVGSKLLEEAMKIAREKGCYKVVGTSRYENEKIHEFYKKRGFKDFGKEFKMYLPPHLN